MRRQFDAACRQYEVKTLSGKNLLNLDLAALNAASVWNVHPTKSDIFESATGKIQFKENTRYTISTETQIPEGSDAHVFIKIDYTDGTRSPYGGWQLASVSNGVAGRRVFTSDAGKTVAAIKLEPGTDGQYEVLWMQIEEGSSATSYEPYVGDHFHWHDSLKSGFPSVKMLGKVEQQNYTGKNLADPNKYSYPNDPDKTSRNWVKKEGDIYYSYCNNDATGEGFPFLKTGVHVTFSVDIVEFSVDADAKIRLFADGVRTDGSRWTNLFGHFTATTGVLSGSLVIPGDVANCVLCVTNEYPANSNRYVAFKHPQIELGSTSTAYEPYVGGVSSPNPQYPQAVKANNATVQSCGKNLFNTLALKKNSLPANITSVSEGEVVITTAEGYVGNGYTRTLLLREFAPDLAVGETYVLSFDAPADSRDFVFLQNFGTGLSDGWVSGTARMLTEEYLNAVVILYGFDQQRTGVTGTCRISNIQIEEGETPTAYEPYFDGGEATAPPLLCAVDGSCQSTYDPQTGKFVNWWWDKITFDGSELWGTFDYGVSKGFWIRALQEQMHLNACWANQCRPTSKDVSGEIRCGDKDNGIYVVSNYYDGASSDRGLANWKAHLAQHPLEVWVARNEPEITNIGPQRLTCPTGYGQIIQMAGDVPNAPLEVKYLAHGGNVK